MSKVKVVMSRDVDRTGLIQWSVSLVAVACNVLVYILQHKCHVWFPVLVIMSLLVLLAVCWFDTFRYELFA